MRLFFHIILLSIIFSNSELDNEIYTNDMELFFHEDIINEFLSSIGSIKGSDKIALFDYSWEVYDLRVDIIKDSSILKGVVKLKSGSFERKEIINGEVNISYNKNDNLIYVQIFNIKIDIDLSDVLNILPKKSFMINIDISNYFSEPFKIIAPQPKEISYILPISADSERIILITLIESILIEVDNGIKIISKYECLNK